MTLPANTEQPGQPGQLGQPGTEPAPKEIDVVNPEPNVNSVLLVAPHAWNKTEGKEKDKDYTDGDYDALTGEIAKKVAEKIGCKALINWDWKKGDREKERKKGERNYNDAKQAGEDKKFISHLEAAGNQETIVLWIHGARNSAIQEEEIQYNNANKKSVKLDAVLGYGQGGSLSAKQDTADNFIKKLCQAGLETVSASEKRNKLCANEAVNMCQWFNLQKNGENPKYPNVQSLQIEIKYADFRNNEENAEKTADILAGALMKHLGIDLTVPAVLKEEHKGETVDPKLVERAYEKLSEIFGRHYGMAMYEAGEYLIKEFYADDYKRVYKKNQPKKNR